MTGVRCETRISPDELGPERDDAVDPPVTDADEPEGEREADEPDPDHQDVRDAGAGAR